jgi:hemolysin activation/secretion protein
VNPNRGALMLRGGVEFTKWSLDSGEGSFPSVDTRYTPAALPGLGADVTYLHTQGTVGFDWRTSSGYTRRGAYVAATLHDYNDRDKKFGFQVADYEGIAHLPILREAWVLSFRARVQTAFDKDGQQIPFFMLPSVGGGSSLRGYSSWRFRDENSLLLQGEWRIMVNRYLDLGFFYDTGKVASRTKDLDLDGLKYDYGLGLRFHGPFATPLRIEVARSRETSFALIFASSASF